MGTSENKPLIPWEAVIAFGIGHLQLPPDQFWTLSFREFRALLPSSPVGLNAPITRMTLEDLVKRYPDGDSNDRP